MNRRKFFGVLAAAPAAMAAPTAFPGEAISARIETEAVVRAAVVSVGADGIVCISGAADYTAHEPSFSAISAAFDQMPEIVRL